MRATAIVTLAGLLAAGCAARRAAAPGPAVPPPSGVQYTMQRQVANAMDAGDGDLTVRLLRARMEAEPDNLSIRLQLAARYEASGFPEVAREHYRLATARFPDEAGPVLELAKSWRRSGDLRQAVKALEQFPQPGRSAPAEVYAWQGILLDELAQYTQAEAAHRKAIALSAPQSYLHNNLGQNLLLQGRAEEAAVEFRRSLELDRQSEIARNNLGIALAADPQQAVAHWKTQNSPAAAHNNLAAVLIERGRYREARQELARALGYDPQYQPALRNLLIVASLDGEAPSVRAESRPSLGKRFVAALARLAGAPPAQNRAKAPEAEVMASRDNQAAPQTAAPQN